MTAAHPVLIERLSSWLPRPDLLRTGLAESTATSDCPIAVVPSVMNTERPLGSQLISLMCGSSFIAWFSFDTRASAGTPATNTACPDLSSRTATCTAAGAAGTDR